MGWGKPLDFARAGRQAGKYESSVRYRLVARHGQGAL